MMSTTRGVARADIDDRAKKGEQLVSEKIFLSQAHMLAGGASWCNLQLTIVFSGRSYHRAVITHTRDTLGAI